MKNSTFFLISFLLITMFTAFQEGSEQIVIASDVKANVLTDSKGNAIVMIEKEVIDSLSSITGLDLSTIDPSVITSENDLKKSLIAAIGSFLTMVIMILLKYFFPSINDRLKKGNLTSRN